MLQATVRPNKVCCNAAVSACDKGTSRTDSWQTGKHWCRSTYVVLPCCKAVSGNLPWAASGSWESGHCMLMLSATVLTLKLHQLVPVAAVKTLMWWRAWMIGSLVIHV